MAKVTKESMVVVILDSNIIICLSKEMIEVEDIFDNTEEYAVSVITYMEVLAYSFENSDEESSIKNLLSFFKIPYIDEEIVKIVIELKKNYKIKLLDAIICATAIYNSATLITNDIRLKNIKNLNLNLMQTSGIK